MEYVQLEAMLRILLSIFAGIAVMGFLVRWAVIEYRHHKINSAQVLTAPATVFYIHPEFFSIPEGRMFRNSTLRYMTFHTDDGHILKLYLTGEDCSPLREGDRGMLTWQSERFWKFEKEV